MLKVFTMVKDLLISLPFLKTDIEVNRVTSSLNKRTHTLLICLLYMTTISSYTLMEYIIPLNPFLIIVFNDKSKPLRKGLVLQVLESGIRVRNHKIIGRLYIIRSRNSINYAYNLVSQLGIYYRHFQWLERSLEIDKIRGAFRYL